ncbi:nucleotide exchange factor GrpE [Dermacoccus nishinomiyaensis]|uniref:nucleotide exchange factor GrpE n=1 Tax=Dermacoccus nishinomiyaensis TaxID=1274 RepID=UPI0013F3DBB1|nr:nucleotide exchange factor GrpE [Dermacoccus nishinomiyaensis]MCG7428592.1 nucleotide exchange factor GrpE [Dermacoccus nishinomiyaensis]NHC32926.1 nucleotide exchange factor GrpE [Dermacoccus nishinomiyaensis]
MTDQNTSGATPHNADGATQGETDNSFAGGVGSDLPGGEQPENLQTRSDEAATQAGPDATSADDAVAEHPDTKLAAERLSDLQRIQAEYVNYRNRVERDRAREKEATIGSVVESLIPVLDDIELARQHGDLTEGPMSKIADKIESTLNRFGVARFGEVDEAFDPSVHEALMHVEAEAPEGVDGTFVVQVLQPGYKVGERVVRPARVSVAG